MGPVFVCDVSALVEPDVAAVDVLVRLQLAARRSGCTVALRQVPPDLGALLDLMGLQDLFPVRDLSIEPIGQPEQREQALGVQEEGDPGDRLAADLDHL
jgi:anti-anti-sigma regulatory factor